MSRCQKCGYINDITRTLVMSEVDVRTIFLYYIMCGFPTFIGIIVMFVFAFHMHGVWLLAGAVIGVGGSIILWNVVYDSKMKLLTAIQNWRNKNAQEHIEH